MSPGKFYFKFQIAELLPVFLAVPCGYAFFMAAVPFAQENWRFYLGLVLLLLVATRAPNDLIQRKLNLAPVYRYLRQKQEGRPFSQADLRAYYLALPKVVPRLQIWTGSLWGISSIVFVSVSWFQIHRNWSGFLTLSFACMIISSLSLIISYFSYKRLVEPLQEEVIGQLGALPQQKIRRVRLRIKLGVTILALTALAFLSFAVLIGTTIRYKIEEYALTTSAHEADALAATLKQAPEEELAGLVREATTHGLIFVLTDAEGREVGSGAQSSPLAGYGEAAKHLVARGQAQGFIKTTKGMVWAVHLEGRDVFLLMAPEPGGVQKIVNSFITIILVFTVSIVVILGAFIVWMTGDTARVLHAARHFNDRLAEGDLRSIPAIWSDDEFGRIADSLRATFLGLSRMVRQIMGASSVMDAEVAEVVDAASELQKQVTEQTHFVEQATQSVKAMEEGIAQISGAMETVANSTEEVTSTILQMQASVEEIATNAEALLGSVEQTVSSSNEMATSAQQVNLSTEQLHGISQETVSFLMELRSALDETQGNAKSLLETSAQVTRNAESGFISVAAVEEEIIKSRVASEQSQGTLTRLSESIEQIGRILDVIQDVTEQTNLLSLNASIIAAGAGEHGRAFAVVASQIRELSGRTANNAKEIRGVIRSLIAGGDEMAATLTKGFEIVRRSVDLSRDSGQALKAIMDSAASQEEMSRRIAIATEELARGGQSASSAMQRISEMVKQIAAAADEQTKSARFLNGESEKIRAIANMLRNSTNEQAGGARLISQAVVEINEDSRRTTQAVQCQADEARAIFDAMREISKTAVGLDQAFQSLSATSARLKVSSSILDQEIRRFSL